MMEHLRPTSYWSQRLVKEKKRITVNLKEKINIIMK